MCFCWMPAGTARAEEWKYSDTLYNALTAIDSRDSVPVGTRIDLSNWKQYRNFIHIGIQALYSGEFFWHIGTDADFARTIVPTVRMSMPYQYLQDTEKYSGQVKLVHTSNGGTTVEGYVAGIPFPNIDPKDPEVAAKLMWDNYYEYVPAFQYFYAALYQVDRYRNLSWFHSHYIATLLDGISEPGMPTVNPIGKGYHLVDTSIVTEPEQSKYTTSMVLLPSDPAKVSEIYVFLPSLRRSLRLSSAARCAPNQGTDYTYDDNRDGFGGIPSFFTATYLGEKKILATFHSSNVYDDDVYMLRSTVPAWPRTKFAPLEVRDEYLIDMRPVPEMAGEYCYSHRVLYIDKDTHSVSGVDSYDKNGRLWKHWYKGFNFKPVDSHNGAYMDGWNGWSHYYDLQNEHCSVNWNSQGSINSGVPAQFRNPELYALPSGLSQIMR
jgi:hypothetical protein